MTDTATPDEIDPADAMFDLMAMLPALGDRTLRPRGIALVDRGSQPPALALVSERADGRWEQVGPSVTVTQAEAVAELVLAGHYATQIHPATVHVLALALHGIAVEDARIARLERGSDAGGLPGAEGSDAGHLITASDPFSRVLHTGGAA